MGRPNGRQARKCSARKTTGEPCRAWAIVGGEVCVAHGGAAPQVKAKAARRAAEEKAQAILAGIKDFEPVTDPIGELERLAGRAVRWLEVLEGIVADLNRIRYTTESEQIDGRIIVFERAMTTAGKLLTDLARLNLDERAVRLQEAQVALLAGALAEALAEAGLAPEQRQAITVRVAELVTAAEDQNAALPAGRR
jgi:hypothetical protein